MERTMTGPGTSERLYQLLEERVKAQGETLPCTMDALRVYASEGRKELDYLKLMELDNRSFFDVCYCLAFNIYPPAHYLEQWKNDIETLPKEEFQRRFLIGFSRLPLYGQWHVRLRNCFCLSPEDMNGFSGKLYAWLYDHFHGPYLRLPESVRHFLKWVAGPVFKH